MKNIFKTKFKSFLSNRKMTMEGAAGELGVSRQHLSKVVNGKDTGGLVLLSDIKKWSKGLISFSDMIDPTKTRLKG